MEQPGRMPVTVTARPKLAAELVTVPSKGVRSPLTMANLCNCQLLYNKKGEEERKKNNKPLNVTSPRLALLVARSLFGQIRFIQVDDDVCFEVGLVLRVYLAHDGLVGCHDGVGEGFVLADFHLHRGGSCGDEGGAEGEDGGKGEGKHF